MKNIFILFAAFQGLMSAQVTLENAYPATASYQSLGVVELVKGGYKYQLIDYKNANVKLYDLNHSLFKNISLPIPSGFTINQAQVSDSLFNTDNLVEVIYTYYAYTTTVTPTTFTYETKVVNESGSTIFTIPQGASQYIAFTGKTSGYKLIVNIDSTNKATLRQINVYSLVGGLPMHVTSTGVNPIPTGIVSQGSQYILSGPTPNPSRDKTIIAYNLPNGKQSDIIFYDVTGREIKRYTVDSNFNTLEVDNGELAPGTYLYSMGGEAKRMVIVK